MKRIFLATPLFAIPLFLGFFSVTPAFAAFATENFFIDPANNPAGQNQIAADLRYTGVHAYFYAEEGYWNSLSNSDRDLLTAKIVQVSNEFDNNIYSTLRSTYGAEWVPGIDNDPRLYILLTEMPAGLGGYVRQNDEQAKSLDAASNAHEMVYLNAQTFLTSVNAKAELAHEFTHVISYNQRERLQGVNEETWLDEALAEYAPTLLGYDNPWEGSILQERARDFEHLPFDSLLEWKGTNSDSATAAIFMYYLESRFGNSLIIAIMHSPHLGIEAVNDALASVGSKENFDRIFTEWAVATYVNGTVGTDASTYQYQNSTLDYDHLHVPPLFTASIFPEGVSPFNVSVKSWEDRWYRFVPSQLGTTGDNVAKVEFQANDPSMHFSVPVVISDIAGNRSVQFMTIQNGYGVLYVPSFGSVNLSISIAPISETARMGATDLPYTSLSLKISLVSDIPSEVITPPQTGQFSRPDGTLIRAQGDTKVYIITNNTKRWIQSPEIMNMYGSLLSWDKIITVTPQERDFYPESFLIREAGDYKVYQVSANGVKQWLDLTPTQFEAKGYSWASIFTVNEREFSWYK